MKLIRIPNNWKFFGNQLLDNNHDEWYIEDFTGSKEYYNIILTFTR